MTLWNMVLDIDKSSVSAFDKIKIACKGDKVRFYKALEEIDISSVDKEYAYRIPECRSEIDMTNRLGLRMSTALNLNRRVWSGLVSKAYERGVRKE